MDPLPEVDDTVVFAVAVLREHVARIGARCGDEVASEWCRQAIQLVDPRSALRVTR